MVLKMFNVDVTRILHHRAKARTSSDLYWFLWLVRREACTHLNSCTRDLGIERVKRINQANLKCTEVSFTIERNTLDGVVDFDLMPH